MKITMNLLQCFCCHSVIASQQGFANMEEAYTLFDLMKKLKLTEPERGSVDKALNDARQSDVEPEFVTREVDFEAAELRALEGKLKANLPKMHASDVQWFRPTMMALADAQAKIAAGRL